MSQILDCITQADLDLKVNKSGDTMTGNLGFSGNGRRITGDLSNNTRENRLSFETSTTNGNTLVQAIPNGTGTIGAYIAYGGSDADNAAYLQVHAEDSSHVGLNSSKSGTGTTQNLVLQIDGVTKAQLNAATGSYQFLQGVNAQIGTTYTLVASDYAKLITFNNASPITLTLPQQSTLTTTDGFWCKVRNLGVGTVNIVKQGSETLDGNTTLITGAEALIERPTTTKWATSYGTAVVNMPAVNSVTMSLATSRTEYLWFVQANATLLGITFRCSALTTAGTFKLQLNGADITGLTGLVPTLASLTTAFCSAPVNLVTGDIVTIVPDGTLNAVANMTISPNFTVTY